MKNRKDPFLLRKWRQVLKSWYARHNHEKLLRLRYLERFGRQPDLDNPATRNEKVLWMLLHADTTRWTLLADKYRVREYVRERGLGWMLNEQYGVWESADAIDFDALPDRFVMKTNNGYGDVAIIRDKHNTDLEALRRKFAHALKRRFGRMSGEHHYLRIPPRIIAEKLLVQDPANEKTGLIDYKIYCFDGEPRYCVVVYDQRTPSDTTEELYELPAWKDRNAEILGFDRGGEKTHRFVPRPASLELMLDAARTLSAGFPLMRVDLYQIDGKPVFGELTLSPAAGMDRTYGEEFQCEMGAWITLPPAAR